MIFRRMFVLILDTQFYQKHLIDIKIGTKFFEKIKIIPIYGKFIFKLKV